MTNTLPPLSVCRLYAAIGPAELAGLLGWTYSQNGYAYPSLIIPREHRFGCTREALMEFLTSVGLEISEEEGKPINYPSFTRMWTAEKFYVLWLKGKHNHSL